MHGRALAIAAATFFLIGTMVPATAAESPQKRDAGGLPKGSYEGSCTCQISGGTTLICYCNNLQAKMFQTTMDVRNCPAPKDIKNCDGNLTCVTGQGAECPSGK